MTAPGLRAVELAVLDVAGTTVDDHGAVYVALRRCVEECGAPVAAADLQTWMGTDKVTAIRALLTAGGVAPTEAVVRGAFARFRTVLDEAYRTRPPVVLPGVDAAVRALRAGGVRVALTTGFTRDVVDAVLGAVGWGVGEDAELDAVVSTSEVPAGRPAPYLVHRAMEAVGATDVRTVLAAGDTVVDLRAARCAGVIAVGVLTGEAPRELLAAADHDHLLDSVADVPALLGIRLDGPGEGAVDGSRGR